MPDCSPSTILSSFLLYCSFHSQSPVKPVSTTINQSLHSAAKTGSQFGPCDAHEVSDAIPAGAQQRTEALERCLPSTSTPRSTATSPQPDREDGNFWLLTHPPKKTHGSFLKIHFLGHNEPFMLGPAFLLCHFLLAMWPLFLIRRIWPIFVLVSLPSSWLQHWSNAESSSEPF